ncbi:hypothetical protein EJ08DRAFT_316036 [Tothia fuscella]|uniref:LIM-domain binding protein-domain-containing protein n=1 Tax=Tothia fuscella TaxID=1048955 RepID=A0A9P4TWZ7_9PEZI|nr:hypothetical protein EJ08DRAFT_316036 [Tothia fuscella]
MMSAFPPHAMQHPGMQHGQPMGPGQPHPGQGMGQPMQMHQGVSGPHGQQIPQAGPMMGMGPGMAGPGGPSVHAMQHLAPGAANQMMQQQQAQQIANNPQFLAQYQAQQRVFMQRQQMQRMQQQGQMPMGQQHPGNPGITPQQLAQMQAAGNVNLPPHLQQQLHQATQQQMMQHQQQQQQAAAAQHAHQQNLAQQQQQAHMAMQHQNSNPGQQAPQPGQPGQQGPSRPPTAMGTSSIESHSSPAPTSGPHQGQQQPPQNQPQQQQPPTSQPQTSGPQMQQAQTQPAMQQPHQQSNPQQQQGQQATAGQQQNVQQRNLSQGQVPMTSQAAQAVYRQQQAQAAQAQSQIRGGTLLKVFNFADKLGSFRADQAPNDMMYWRRLVNQHFTEDGVFRVIVKQSNGVNKTFEVNAAALPRYFFMHYENDMDQIQLLLDGTQEQNISETHQFITTNSARMVYWFRDGTQLVWNGRLTALYVGGRIDTLSFEAKEHVTYLPRTRIEELCQMSPDQNKSPRMTKTAAKQRNPPRQPAPAEPSLALRNLPRAPVNELGLMPRIQAFLEVGETMSYMQDLMFHSKEHPELSVSEALNQMVQNYSANNNAQNFAANSSLHVNGVQNPNFQGGNGMQGNRNPNASMMRQTNPDGSFIVMSPAMQPSFLPGNQANGSPHLSTGSNTLSMNAHTPSPHQSNMAPPMAPQLSQQGSQTGASANTSPNVSGKRRRSTVQGIKAEGDGEAVNGTGGSKTKPSPRMGGNKRMKNS